MGTGKVAIIDYAEREMKIMSPYDPAFVAELKAACKHRKWDIETKEWKVDILERQQALDVIRKFYSIIENNQPPEVPDVSSNMGDIPLPTDVTPEWLADGNLEIWIDGACVGNPGPGGYGIVFSCRGQKKAKSGGFILTTNNRMEIMGAIIALESLPQKSKVVIFSDSKYLVDAIMLGWAQKWKLHNWKRNKKDKVINPDLWDRLLKLHSLHDVEFRWIKGHSSQTENELCDQLAEKAARQPTLPIDTGYKTDGDKLI